MKSLYKLITKTNLKSPALAFPLVMPLIFVLLYSIGVEGTKQIEGVNHIINMDLVVAGFLTTILSVQTMQSGLMGFGINFMRIKKSVLLRRIGATKLNKWDVVLAVFFYGLTMWLISTIWILVMITFFNAIGLFYSISTIPGVENVYTTTKFSFFKEINWLKLAASLVVMLLISFSIGLFFTSIAHDASSFQGMAMLYFFLVSFMGGMMFPGEIPGWMTYVGYVLPHVYAGELFKWAAGTLQPPLSEVKLALDFVVPLVFTAIFMYGAVKKLKFD